MVKACFECSKPASENHHVIPVSLGGTKTVPLCISCHDKVHDKERGVSRVTTSALVKAAREKKKHLGENPGGHLPYGFRKGKNDKLIPFEPEQAALRKLFALRKEGFSYKKIASVLNETGFPPRGSSWHPTSIARILKRKG